MPDFDAVITLGAHHIEPARQAAAMAAARTAVEAVPGACWIEVGHDGAYPPTQRPVTVYLHGRAVAPDTAEWRDLANWVEAVALAAAQV